MCESKIVTMKNGQETILANEVTSINVKEGEYDVTSMDKGSFTVKGTLTKIDLVGHKVIITQ